MSEPNHAGWPRVTALMRDMGYYRDYHNIDPKHARRGRLVHAGCHLLAANVDIADYDAWVERNEKEHNIQLRGYFEGMQKFLREHDWRLTGSEIEIVSSNDRYVGHADELGYLDGILALTDIKTGVIIPKCTALQLAFYAKPINIQTRYCLHLPGDGTYKLQPYTSWRDFDAVTRLAGAWWDARSYR
jgi:hypothetical protein